MSRTVHPTRNAYLGGVAGVAAVLLLTACGGGDGDGSPEPTAAAGAAGTTAEAGGSDFCSRAAGIDERVDSALASLGDDDPSLADAFRQIAAELRGITAPAPITADWQTMASGMDRMADAFADLDLTDLDALESLEQAEGELTSASENVDAYLEDECGL